MRAPSAPPLGYNQLLTTNSVELMAELGDDFIAALTKKAESLSGEGRKALERKIAIVRRMVDFSRTVPDSWSEHENLAATPQGLGVHAWCSMSMSVRYCKRKSF